MTNFDTVREAVLCSYEHLQDKALAALAELEKQEPVLAMREPSLGGILFAVEQAVKNGCCPFEIEVAFDAYAAECQAELATQRRYASVHEHPPCKGISCGITSSAQKHSPECLAEAAFHQGWSDHDGLDLHVYASLVKKYTAPVAQQQEPVATVTSETKNPDISMSWWHEPALPVGTKLYAAPVAQQYEAGDMASAAAQGFRDGAASVAQQPQARTDFTDEWTGYLKDGETPFERFLRERKDLDALTKLYQRALEENERLKAQQPQAECRSDGRCQYAIDHGAEGLGHCPKGKCVLPEQRRQLHLKPLYEGTASQQAEAVPGAAMDAMVDAYLQANDAYWRETDTQPKSPVKWRNGNPKEATRVSLAAALAAAPKGQP